MLEITHFALSAFLSPFHMRYGRSFCAVGSRIIKFSERCGNRKFRIYGDVSTRRYRFFGFELSHSLHILSALQLIVVSFTPKIHQRYTFVSLSSFDRKSLPTYSSCGGNHIWVKVRRVCSRVLRIRRKIHDREGTRTTVSIHL